jgi:hypothetical protein
MLKGKLPREVEPGGEKKKRDIKLLCKNKATLKIQRRFLN